ncbi:MAG: FtsX-like permease family protein, partial [Pelobium sp.]
TIKNLEHKLAEFAPGLPFSYFFSDEAYDKLYQSNDNFQKVFTCLSAVAILISCLGLFGLSTFSMTQRKKEIGVRKVLGASVIGILQLLSFDFIKLVLVALVIATPIAWFGMHYWLQEFAYQIDIAWWVFVLAGMLAMLIAFITISFQAIKAALANPIKSLRTE